MSLRLSEAQARDLFGDAVAPTAPKHRKAGTAASRLLRRLPVTIETILVPVSCDGLKLQPEQSLSAQLYNRLVTERRAGRLRATWTCVQHELPIPTWTEQLKRLAVRIGLKRRAMGCVPGASDWAFIWAGGGCWIELKCPGGDVVVHKVKRSSGPAFRPARRAPGRLKPEQVAFQNWCRDSGVPAATCVSVEECLAFLHSCGAPGTR